MAISGFTIKSYDGTQTYASEMSDQDMSSPYVLSTGFMVNWDGSPYYWTYTGTDTFMGFALTPNATTVDYPAPTPRNMTPLPNTGTLLLYAVGSDDLSNTVKKITYDNKPIQVESAIRDGTGVIISTEYVRHAEYTETISTSQQYHKNFSALSLGTNSAGNERIPRIVEIFNASGEQIYTDVTIDTTNSRITLYPTACDPSQTWTVRVTAW